VLNIKKELYTILSKHSGQSYEKIHEVSDRDFWMDGNEAKEFGIVDEVLGGN
jgi:ATP-dependent Clp protease protease subunit